MAPDSESHDEDELWSQSELSIGLRRRGDRRQRRRVRYVVNLSSSDNSDDDEPALVLNEPVFNEQGFKERKNAECEGCGRSVRTHRLNYIR